MIASKFKPGDKVRFKDNPQDLAYCRIQYGKGRDHVFTIRVVRPANTFLNRIICEFKGFGTGALEERLEYVFEPYDPKQEPEEDCL